MTQIILVELLKVSDHASWIQILSCVSLLFLTHTGNRVIRRVKTSRSPEPDLRGFRPTATVHGGCFTFIFFFVKYERVWAGWLKLWLWSVDPAVMYEWEYGTIWIIISGIRAASKQIISWLNNFAGLYHTSLTWSSAPTILDMNCVSIISPARAGWALSTARYDLVS